MVDGDAESQALKLITSRIGIPNTNIIDPIFASMQPKSSPEQIARAAKTAVDMLRKRGADLIIILIDREDREECCGRWAQTLENTFSCLGHSNIKVTVKNRKLENWLIADPNAFEQQAARYSLNRRFKSSVVSNKADNVPDAELLINSICCNGRYHKRRDAAKIAQLLSIETAATNSRSFRRFLRQLSHPRYSEQSRRP